MTTTYLSTYSPIFILILLVVCIILIIQIFRLNKKISLLSLDIAHTDNRSEQRFQSLLEITNSISEDLPLIKHPAEYQKSMLKKLHQTLNDFSKNISQEVKNTIEVENNIWNDKFSALLEILDHDSKELEKIKDSKFKESWDSIDKIRKHSQLLFHDMKEDGIFFRINSLWTLSTQNLTQENFDESWRHLIAAIKLYCDSKPKLPITNSLIWQVCRTLHACSLHCSKDSQMTTLSKFNLSAEGIIDILSQLPEAEDNLDTLQLLKIWSRQFV